MLYRTRDEKGATQFDVAFIATTPGLKSIFFKMSFHCCRLVKARARSLPNVDGLREAREFLSLLRISCLHELHEGGLEKLLGGVIFQLKW